MEVDGLSDPDIDLYTKEVQRGIRGEEEKLKRLLELENELKGTLLAVKDLPTRLRHDIIVPFGPHAFFPGQLIHTNEVTVHLGEKYYAEVTAPHAHGIIQRRLSVVRQSIAGVRKQLSSFRDRIQLSSHALGLGQPGDVREIKHTVEESDTLLSSAEASTIDHAEASTSSSARLQHVAKEDFIAVMRGLDKLEAMEQASASGQNDPAGELDEPDSDDDEFFGQNFLPPVLYHSSAASPGQQLDGLQAPESDSQREKAPGAVGGAKPQQGIRKGFLVQGPQPSPGKPSTATASAASKTVNVAEGSASASVLASNAVGQASPSAGAGVGAVRFAGERPVDSVMSDRCTSSEVGSQPSVRPAPPVEVAFTGQVLERNNDPPCQDRISGGATTSAQPEKRVSRFMMQRGKQG